MSATESHTIIEESFSAYIDGDLGPDAKVRLEQHLAGCLSCRVHLEKFRRTVGRMADLKRSAPPSFLADIQSQIHRRSRGRFFGRRWLLFGRIPFEWVSLVMIVAMLVYYIATLQGAPTGVTPVP